MNVGVGALVGVTTDPLGLEGVLGASVGDALAVGAAVNAVVGEAVGAADGDGDALGGVLTVGAMEAVGGAARFVHAATSATRPSNCSAFTPTLHVCAIRAILHPPWYTDGDYCGVRAADS